MHVLMLGKATVVIPWSGEFNAAPIARCQQHLFALPAAVPDRSNGMNDVRSRKTIALRQFRIAGPAAAEKTAFGQQLRSGCATDGAAHAAARKERFVCGIHDRADAQGGDIGLNGAKRCRHDGKTPFTVGRRIV